MNAQPDATPDEAPDNLPSKSFRRRLARMLAYTLGLAVALGAGYWLFERFMYAQAAGVDENKLLIFLSGIASDFVQIGIPVIFGAVTILSTGVAASQIFGGVLKKYLGIPDPNPPQDIHDASYFEAMAMRQMHWARIDELEGEYPTSTSGFRRKITSLQNKVSALEEKCGEETTKGIFDRICQRLSFERSRLSGNSRTNLSIGIVSSLLALGVLGLPLLNSNTVSAPETIIDASFWRQYATRLPVGLLLQFVSFFFLRLYVACEMDIKSNKNEITNIEAKYLAYMMSISNGGNGSDVVKNLSETERNFILKKDEKTIGIENDSRYNDLKESVDKVLGAVSARMG